MSAFSQSQRGELIDRLIDAKVSREILNFKQSASLLGIEVSMDELEDGDQFYASNLYDELSGLDDATLYELASNCF